MQLPPLPLSIATEAGIVEGAMMLKYLTTVAILQRTKSLGYPRLKTRELTFVRPLPPEDCV